MTIRVSRRIFATGLAGAAAGIGLTGCGIGGGPADPTTAPTAGGGGTTGAAPAGAPTPQVDCQIPAGNLDAAAIDRTQGLTGEIRFATQNLKNDFGDFFNGLIEKFESENPGTKINWEDTPQAEDFDSRMVTDAQTCVMADVINVPGGTIKSLTQANLLMDLDHKAPGIGDRFITDVWSASGLGPDGHHTALPWYWAPAVITYNKKIFSEVGLDPEVTPKDFDELYEFSKKITQDSGGKYQALWGNPKWNILDIWLNHGATVLDDNNRLIFADEEFPLHWLTKFAELFELGAIPKDSVTGAPDPSQRYNEGTLAFGSLNASFLRQVRRNAPDVYEHTGVGPMYRSVDNISFSSSQYVSVSVTTQNAPLALAWADYVTNAENQLAWAKDPNVVIFPSTPESLDDPFFTEQDESDPLGRGRIVAAEAVKEAAVNPAVFVVTGRILDTLLQEIQLATNGSKDPKDALATAQEQGNALLERAEG